MKQEEQLRRVVAEVLRRLLPRIGADGMRGRIVVVFTAATVGFSEALAQVRSLILSGFQVQLVFSEAAEQLYGAIARQQLEGFPEIVPFDASHWLHDLKEARAVVVPLLSVNSLSKLSLLIADNLPANLLLHGLFLGKPVVIAQNGVDPAEAGRGELGFDQGSPLLAHAIRERLQSIAGYGCMLTDITGLGAAVDCALAGTASTVNHAAVHTRAGASVNHQTPQPYHNKIITSADILAAFRSGANRMSFNGARTTPLARDLARKHGISLTQDEFVNV